MDEVLKNSSIPIVVIGYNRPQAMKRLLHSLAKANYASDKDIELIISIDKSDSEAVAEVANAFDWAHGKKQVIAHEKNLGLRKHILFTGDLAQKYGAIIMLEDDLFVSPHFYEYTQKAIAFYKEDEKLAGISLYAYDLVESTFDYFRPLLDGSDVHFMQLPSSCGQAWTAHQWQGFRNWLKQEGALDKALQLLPNHIKAWSERSWKKWYVAYMMATDKYFVFPNESLTTNFGDVGTHGKGDNLHQVPISIFEKNYSFKALKDSSAIYDPWYELYPHIVKAHNPELAKYDLSIDLFGAKQKEELTTEYVLTTQECKNALASYSDQMRPTELNVLLNIKGDAIQLCKKSELIPSKRANIHNRFRKYYYTKAKMRNKLKRAADDWIEKWF